MALVRCKNYDKCKHMIAVKDQPARGRRQEYCSDACRQECCRRARANNKKFSSDYQEKQSLKDVCNHLNGHGKAAPISTSSSISKPVQNISSQRQRFQHDLVQEQGYYSCRMCGWSWTSMPIESCPELPRYAPETKPEFFVTQDELKQVGLWPGNIPLPEAVIYHEDLGWQCLYDRRKVPGI